ncbi:Transcriptional regulator, AraC family [Leucobacter sp. 7(1)]|uniref:helix-turn-helix transcriptional regulator n=1 Tax=Leucobacter sp. 7(1) TaxID=1255613 RepID=UPI00097EE997|nr:helix-turn-helix transcriptional regulator [Leucobacter sp. 7(1)]SJN08100.1 Transcriptional regulator, AraC family [Leucobacter sp. 7(1)]
MAQPNYEEWVVPGVGVVWRAAGGGAPRTLPADGSADLILREDILLVAGPSTRAFTGQGSRSGATIGLRFLPGLAGAALQMDAAALRDTQVPGSAALDPADARRGSETLRRIRDLAEPGDSHRELGRGRSASVESELLRVVRTAVGTGFGDRVAEPGWTRRARLGASRGESATEIARALGYSDRQLQRRMNAAFGYGVATLRRVLRAERAQRLIAAGQPLSDVAFRVGFSDQAHLTREFSLVAGTTPGRWAAARTPGVPV